MLHTYSLCPTTIVVLAQYLSDQVHKEVHVSSHIDVQVQTCNDAPGSELRRQRQRDGGSMPLSESRGIWNCSIY